MTTTPPGLNSPALVRDLEIALGLRPSEAEDIAAQFSLAARLSRAIALDGAQQRAKNTNPL